MSAQGQRKKPPVFSSSAKNDFVTNYEPVVHLKQKKMNPGTVREKAREMRESELMKQSKSA